MKSFMGKWKSCRRCGLSETRRQVVIGEGDVPAEILIVGEAPGKSEDLLGIPFCGPSGVILHSAIKDACKMGGGLPLPRTYITNVVACRPTDSRQGPNRIPSSQESGACAPRLQHIAERIQPRIIILLGKVAQKECKYMFPHALNLVHPAYLLRTGGRASEGYLPFVRMISEVISPRNREAKRNFLEEITPITPNR